MALCLLAQDWAKAQKRKLIAITVDHGLRQGSAKEAKQVGAWLKKHRIAHVVLTWRGRKPTSNIQEAARKGRYRLLSEYCRTQGICEILVAHTLDDQAETFLLRLARGSGIDGLSCMSSVNTIFGLTLVRPLLGISKNELVAYLKARKQDFIMDPSNENPIFDRVKMRKLLPQLASMGLTTERLAKTAQIMSRARAHLEEETGKFLTVSCKLYPHGYALMEKMPVSEEIGLRALTTLIMIIGGQEVKTRLNDLERLYHALKAPRFRGATLGGCIFAPHKSKILICREPRAVAKPAAIKPGESILWDNRFEIKCHQASSHKSCQIGALGQNGWLTLSRIHKMKNPCPDKRILYTLPCLRNAHGNILSVPLLGWTVQKNITCEAQFKQALNFN